VEEVETELAERFLKLRVRDRSVAPLPEAEVAPPDTVLGAFIRDLEAQIAELEASRTDDVAAPGDAAEAAMADGPSGELRDALRLGRLLLSGTEVTL